MIRVVLPGHLRTLARVSGEVTLEIEGPVTQRSIIDALEAKYPTLGGTLRDYATGKRRPFVRFFACQEDLSHESPDAPVPEAVATGAEPFLVVGAVAGGGAHPSQPVQAADEVLARYKQVQRESWARFAPLEVITSPSAAHLVRFAGISAGAVVLDVGCGTGVVAITAARLGADVQGIDLTPGLLERAGENARIAGLQVGFREGDVEELPFADGQFDIVLSQFAHMFAPRPEVAVNEMLRVLKPGGTIAFSTWPPELLVGSTMALGARYMPPLPEAIANPLLWGDPNVVRERLGSRVTDLVFDRGRLYVAALSPEHFRLQVEGSAGPVIKLIENLTANAPEQLPVFRRQFDSIVARFFRDNLVRQDYLLSRARKT